MNSTADARSALRDLLQFHFGSYAWLAALFAIAAVSALAVLLYTILSGQPNIGVVAPVFRVTLAYTAALCWLVSVICAYAGGFVMGRLYSPKTNES